MRPLLLVLAGLSSILAGCAAMPVLPPSATHVRPEPAPPGGSIPAPVQISSALPKPRPIQKPETYSVVVNNVKVQDLLFALARDAKLNIDINPGISGVVTLNAVDQTLPQLLSRIGKQVDMRWELDGPNLVVMPDSPYLRIYKIDYLNMERLSSSTVGISSQITAGAATAGGGTGGAAGGNTSSATLRNVSDNKFWDTLIKNVEEILRETDKVIPTGAQQPAPVPPPPQPGGQAGGAPAAPAQASVANVTYREAASVIANKEAGIVSIRATLRQHEKIQEFLDQVLSSAKRQVLIEATIVEVQLNNEFQQGIDWSLMRRGPSGINISETSSGFPATTTSPTNLFLGNIADPAARLGSFSATIRLLESFGNVRVLSSPKLSVLNNQTAILKVVDEIVYFNVQVSTSAVANAGTVTSVNTTPQTVPIGFILSVTPQIGESDAVLLNLRPSLTRVVTFVRDPNPALTIANLIPQVQRREMESLIKVNSGQIAVMGGLIQDTVTSVDAGIPGVNRTPFDLFFSQRSQTNAKTELVVFLRPLVIKDPSIDGDYRAFRAFAPDETFLSRPTTAKPLVNGEPPR
jgi:MSHA biogenesis protein MshL